jgi:hypothetical protein
MSAGALDALRRLQRAERHRARKHTEFLRDAAAVEEVRDAADTDTGTERVAKARALLALWHGQDFIEPAAVGGVLLRFHRARWHPVLFREIAHAVGAVWHGTSPQHWQIVADEVIAFAAARIDVDDDSDGDADEAADIGEVAA